MIWVDPVYSTAVIAAFGVGDADGGTETTEVGAGRQRGGSAENFTELPVSAAPARIVREPVRVMAQRTPNPTLVNGRPT